MILKYNEFIKETISNFTPEYYGITKYEWVDERLDCYQDVDLYSYNLYKIPFQFGIVYGSFTVEDNKLTSLKGAPETVNGDFNCSKNKLSNLDYSPKIVGNNYGCQFNDLITNLEKLPKEIPGDLYYFKSSIGDIDFFPRSIIRGNLNSGHKILHNYVSTIKENVEKLIPLSDDKVKFHQMIMRLNPNLIKYYKTIQQPSKKTIL